MSSQNPEDQPQQPPERQPEPDIPDDPIEIAQVQYSWIWSSWWLLLIVFLLYLFLDPITPSVLVFVILIPKFWQWRRTRYYLTEDKLIYQRGGILQTPRYQIPFNKLKETRARHGMFGRTVGFQHVDIMLENGAVATLQYIPAHFDVAGYINERIGGDTSQTPTDEDSDDERPAIETQ